MESIIWARVKMGGEQWWGVRLISLQIRLQKGNKLRKKKNAETCGFVFSEPTIFWVYKAKGKPTLWCPLTKSHTAGYLSKLSASRKDMGQLASLPLTWTIEPDISTKPHMAVYLLSIWPIICSKHTYIYIYHIYIYIHIYVRQQYISISTHMQSGPECGLLRPLEAIIAI